MIKKKRFTTLAALLVVSVIFTGCSFSGNTDSANSGANTGNEQASSTAQKELKLYVENEIKDLNQWSASDTISYTILNNVGEGLYRLDQNEEPQPAIAESTEISEDKLTYTFTLRDGVKWNDGSPVTAADFEYAWLREMNPETSTNGYAFILTDYIVGGSEYANGEAEADGVAIEAKDDKTLVVKLKQPTPFFLRLTSLAAYLPMKEDFVVAQGDKYALAPENMLFNGPYTVTSFDTASGAVLEKNAGYWDADNVNVDKINLKVIKEQSTALNAYKAGQLDRVLLSSSDVNASKSEPGFGTGITYRTTYLQFNTQAEGLSNVNIRKALSLGFDSTVLANHVLNNGSVGSTGLIPDGMSGIGEKSFRELQGDVIKADAAGAKALWDQGVAELGSAPKIALLVADDSLTKDIATFMQSEYKRTLGIDVQIDTKTAKARNQLMDNNEYQMAVTGWGADYDDAMTYMDLWTNHTPYRGGYENATYDQLIADAKKEPDDQKRIDMMLQAEKILVQEDAVVAPIFFTGYSFLQNPNVEDLIYHPYGTPVDFKYANLK